jgi:uncharacterized protein
MMQLTESDLKWAVDALSRRHLLVEKSGFGSRVPKYQQIFCNTEFGSLRFTPQETAVVCELLLRGPQTPGELRSRTQRMAPASDPNAMEATLTALANRPGGALVVRLTREAGRRDSRWAQLFEDLPESLQAAAPGDAPDAPGDATGAPRATHGELTAKVAALENEIAALRAELAQLRQGRVA